MRIEKRSLAQLLEFPGNPRAMSELDRQNLAASISRYGQLEPIIVNERTGHIVSGHQRRAVLLERHETEAEVVIVDLDLAHEKALNLALNRIKGEWDYDKLIGLLRGFSTDEMRMNTGFSPDEIANMTSLGFQPGEAPELPSLPDPAMQGHEYTCPNCHETFTA